MVINLLPIEIKQQSRQDYYYRLGTLALLFLAIIFVAGTIIELTRGASVLIQTKDWISDQAQEVDAGELTLRQEATQVVTKTNRQMAVLQPLSDSRPTPSMIIDLLLDTRPTGIKLQTINYLLTPSGAKIALTGIAGLRSQLLAWEEDIEQLPEVNRIDSPLSNLVKDQNATFSLEVEFDLNQTD